MNEVKLFCIEKNLSQEMEDAFIMYVKSPYALRFVVNKQGDTIKGVVDKLTRSQVLDAWNSFIGELKTLLPQ